MRCRRRPRRPRRSGSCSRRSRRDALTAGRRGSAATDRRAADGSAMPATPPRPSRACRRPRCSARDRAGAHRHRPGDQEVAERAPATCSAAAPSARANSRRQHRGAVQALPRAGRGRAGRRPIDTLIQNFYEVYQSLVLAATNPSQAEPRQRQPAAAGGQSARQRLAPAAAAGAHGQCRRRRLRGRRRRHLDRPAQPDARQHGHAHLPAGHRQPLSVRARTASATCR